jgi:hypothetical protein
LVAPRHRASANENADLGRSERHALTSTLNATLLHLLTSNHQLTRRSRSWVTSIRTQRSVIAKRLVGSPSLRSQTDDSVARAYHRARIAAEGETGLDEDARPATCPDAWHAVTTRPIPWPSADGQA